MTNSEAIKTLQANYPDACYEQLRAAVDKAIKALEAQEREKGKWIPKPDEKFHCNKCDGIAPRGYRWDFCQNCGADMRGEQE